jgi:hypothetical protein
MKSQLQSSLEVTAFNWNRPLNPCCTIYIMVYLLYQTLTDIVGYGNGIKSGPVVVMDAKTIKIPAFSYDGKGEEVYFFAGEGPQPSSKVPNVADPGSRIRNLFDP